MYMYPRIQREAGSRPSERIYSEILITELGFTHELSWTFGKIYTPHRSRRILAGQNTTVPVDPDRLDRRDKPCSLVSNDRWHSLLYRGCRPLLHNIIREEWNIVLVN